MNVFKFSNFDVMIDYAHNTGGFMELKNYIDSVNAPAKIGIITAVGDRRDEDIRNIGYYAAQMFTQVIIRHDLDLRGRTGEEISNLIIEGARNFNKNIPVSVIPNEQDALIQVMTNAINGTFIFISTDNINRSIAFVQQLKEESEKTDSQLFTLSKVS